MKFGYGFIRVIVIVIWTIQNVMCIFSYTGIVLFVIKFVTSMFDQYGRPFFIIITLAVSSNIILYVRTFPCMYATLTLQDKVSARLKCLMEQLQNCVDPFDLDVFTPYIQAHLHRQLQRSNVS